LKYSQLQKINHQLKKQKSHKMWTREKEIAPIR